MTTTGGWLKGRMKGGGKGGGGGGDEEKKQNNFLSSSVKYLVPEAVTEALKSNQYSETRKH